MCTWYMSHTRKDPNQKMRNKEIYLSVFFEKTLILQQQQYATVARVVPHGGTCSTYVATYMYY